MSSVRHARHARPGIGARITLHNALIAGGAAGVLAIPITATLVAESPHEASAAAREGATTTVTAVPASAPVLAAPAFATTVLASPALAAQLGTGTAVATDDTLTKAQNVAITAAAAEAAAARTAAAQAAAAAAQVAAAQAEASRSRAAAAAVDLAAASADPRAVAQELLTARGQGDQFSCLNSLWTKESGWNPSADNPSSDAYGIPQSLPGSKMASAGADWRTNPRTQILWGLSYIAGSYGSPCAAWSHSQSYNWY